MSTCQHLKIKINIQTDHGFEHRWDFAIYNKYSKHIDSWKIQKLCEREC